MEIKRKSGALSSTVIYCLSSVITKLVTLLTTPIFTRIMTSEEYGQYMLYVSLYAIVASVASVPVSSGVIYNIFIGKEDKVGSISLSGFLLSLPINALFCLLLFAFSGFLKIAVSIIPLLFIHITFDVLVSAYLARSRYFYRAHTVLVVEVAKALLSVVISYFLVSRLSLGYIGRVLGFLLSLVPFVIPALTSLLPSIKDIRKDTPLQLIKNSSSVIPSTLFLSGGIYSVSILVSTLLDSEALASFSIFNTVATSPVFIITAIITAISPYVQRKMELSDIKSVERVHKLSLKFLSSIIMVIFLMSREVLSFLAPRRYGENIFILLPLLLYAQLKLSDQMVGCVLSSKRIYAPSVISNLLFLLFSVVSLFLLLPRIGLLATGISLCLAISVSLVYKLYFLARWDIRLSLSADIFLHLLLSSAFGMLALSLIAYPEIRILLAVFPAIRTLDVYFADIQKPKAKGV